MRKNAGIIFMPIILLVIVGMIAIESMFIVSLDKGMENTNIANDTQSIKTNTDDTQSIKTDTSDTQKYIGLWYDTDKHSELTISSIIKGTCLFSWSIYRLTGIDNVTVSLENNKGSFYYQGYEDKNFNSMEDEGEHFYRKATISFDDDTITIKVENINKSDYDTTREITFDGKTFLTDSTFTYRIK